MKTWSFLFLSFLVFTVSCLSFDHGVSQSEEAEKNKFREREATLDALGYPNFDEEDVNQIHQNPEKEEKIINPMFSDEGFFDYTLLTLFLVTPPTFLSLIFLSAPYGKHRRPGWGPTIPPPLAWFLMESPTVWLTLLLFPHGKNRHDVRAIVLISPFLLHYLHRTLVYPLRLLLKTRRVEKKSSGFPVSIASMAFGFNLLNAYLQSRWVSEYADLESDGWFWWRMAAGAAVFGCGVAVNVRSDNMLMGLKESGGGYKIPRGGLFEYVSCPNYLGEIVEWLGWALMTWSWAGLGFFLYTCANLVPRAGQNHRWYLEKFGEDYPRDRKAVIPFVY